MAMKKYHHLVASGLLLISLGSWAQTSPINSPERGKTLFATCAACHPTSPDGMHSLGPNLRGVLGRKIGHVPGFKFSKGLATQEAVWDEKLLDAFIENPRLAIPNSAMPYAGLKDAADRKAVIDYMISLR